MKKLFLVLCMGGSGLYAYALSPITDITTPGTYQPYQPTIARQPITRAQRMQMIRQNDMIRLQATQNRLITLYDRLADLKTALVTDPVHADEIQKTIGMVNDTIDEYEKQVEQYKKTLGVE